MRKNKNIIRIVLVAASILLLPLLAMQITDEIVWDLADFVVAGTLLIGTGLMYELVVKKISNAKHRLIAVVALVIALLIIWAQLAVGIV